MTGRSVARIVKWLVFGTVAFVVVVLSLANRHAVTFSLAPLPFEIDMPLYLLLLAAVLIGVILGGAACAWSTLVRARRKAAASRRLAVDAAAASKTEANGPRTEHA